MLSKRALVLRLSVISVVTGTVHVASGPAWSQAKFDSTSLTRKESANPKVEKTVKSDPKQNKMKIDLTLQEDPKKIETQIKALNLIIKTERDRQKKISLYLRKSYLHVSVAKMLGLNRQRKADITPQEKFHLEEARKILSFLLKNIENDTNALASIYNVMGLVEFETDQQEKTVEYFKKSIDLNPKSAQAETMAVYIAEYYFDIDKYEDAIRYYRLLYKQMSPYQKALADYKVAWCYINLRNYAEAETGFVKIIRENFDKGVVEDSYKDLAFIITQEREEASVLQKSRDAFPQPQLRAKFLYFCLMFYMQQSKNNPRPLLFREVFSIQEDPYERTKLYALKVSFEKRDFPTSAVYNAILEMDKHLAKNEKVTQKYLAADAHQFEEDSEVVIRQFVDAYLGKLKTQENLSKDFLAKGLIQLISTHLRWFPNTDKLLPLYNLWIDSCVDVKNSECLLNLEKDLKNRSADRKDLGDAVRRVQLEILTLYDNVYSKNPQKHEASFMFRLKSYVETYPKDPNTLRIQKRIYSIHVKNKHFPEALKIAEDVYKREPSADHLQKLWYTQFELGQYDEILQSREGEKFPTPDLVDIRREASLKSAQKNANDGKFDKYEADLKVYLASNPSEEKAIVVYQDYFNRLLEQKKWDTLTAEWTKMSDKLKEKKDFYSFRSRAMDQMIDSGLFVKIPGFWSTTTDVDVNFQILIHRRGMNERLSPNEIKELKSLNETKRNYVLNLLALTQPVELQQWLSSQKNLTENDKKFLYLATLLEKKNSDFVLTPQQLAPIKHLVPERHWPDAQAKIEKDLKNLTLPTPKYRAERYNKMVEEAVGVLKTLRRRGFNAIKDLTIKQKMRVINQLIENEDRMAQAILQSPIPKGLNEEQTKQYNEGLAELAKEYQGQSEEFKKAKAEIEALLKKDMDSEQVNILPEISPDQWDLPSGPAREHALQLLSKTSPASALIFLDQKMSQKLIPPEDYYRLRGGVLIRISNSEAMRRVIFEEWTAAKQVTLIEKWRSLKK